jgi:putative Ig domain-containing protein
MPSTLTFITESIPQFTVGVFQEFVLEPSGGTPPYTLAITQGSLPPGLNFDPDGTISGTPEEAGTFTPFFKLTDSAGDHLTQAMEVQVADSETGTTTTSTLTFITESIPQFTVGVFQEFALEASGGTPPYTFEITQGNLPQGLTFDTDGTISGTPEVAGTFTPFFKLTDSAGDHLTQAMEVTVAAGETSKAYAS